MEEELQQSVMLSDEDAGFETADSAGEDAHTLGAVRMGTTSTDIAENDTGGNDGMEVDEDDDELSDRDASGEEIDEEMDQDAEGEEYTELVDQQIVVSNGHHLQRNDEDEEDEDDNDEADEDGDEGVGAVKIKPGDTDEEDDDDEDDDADDDAESDVSDLLSVAEDDSDEEPAWEEARGVEEDDDDESETAPSNVCMFCRQDEENDPSEDFEAFLTCIRCNENGGCSKRLERMSGQTWLTDIPAHQQCARDAAAMSEQNSKSPIK
jgi:histone acetyltransferase SAS3